VETNIRSLLLSFITVVIVTITIALFTTAELSSKSSTSLLAGVKVGRVHLCRVAGNTVIPYGR